MGDTVSLLCVGREDVLCLAVCWQCRSISCSKPTRSQLQGSLSFLFVLSLSKGFEADHSHQRFYPGKPQTVGCLVGQVNKSRFPVPALAGMLQS